MNGNSGGWLRLLGDPGVLRDRKRKRPGLIDVAPSTWWQWVSEGRAPAPIRRGRCTFWRESDIRSFMEQAQ